MMIVRKKSAIVHQTQHYKLYKSGKYLVTSAIMGLSVLGALTFDNPTRVHADSTAKDQVEAVNEDGNAITTTSANATPKTSSNNEQSIYTDSKVNQETAPVRATAQTTNYTANRLNIINLNTALQQNTQSSQNEKSLMTNLAVSNEAAQTDVVNKVKATGVTPNTNQIVALTDYGAKGDSQTDDTQALQKAFDSINQAGGGILDIPAGNYMIKATNATNEAEATIPWQTNQGVKVPSNTTLYFEKGAKLSVIPNASWNYCLLNLANSKNVNILNGELVGDRDKHDTRYTKAFRTATKYQGETGWGILMTGAENVNIIGNNIHDFWGDGIDLYGDNANPGVNSNIVIRYNTLNYNRRQGISVENVNGLIFDHNLVENTDGTAPRAGMDIEPANFKDPSMRIAHDITITNNIFRNNNGSGLMTYGLSTHAEGFNDGPSRISNLTIKNNTFDGNNTNSFAVEGTAGEGAWNWQQNMNGQLTVLGTSNATVENNKFINPNPKGININEANGNASAVIAANTYKTAGMFVGFNENAQIHNNYLPGQDIFVTGNQSPSYAFQNISGSVTNNYANAVIANGTLNDATKKAVVPDGQNYKDTAAIASFIASTGAPENTSGQIEALKQAANADAIISEAKSYGVAPVTKNVVTVADYGITGDSTTDVTAKIQTILDQVKNDGGGIVYVPAGTYMIRADNQTDPVLGWQNNKDGLQVGANTTILLDKNAVLKVIANPASGYTVLNLINADNSNVLGGTIQGDRYSHLLTTPFNIRNGEPFYGEWGTGINVTGGDHASLVGTVYKDFWGDGISVFPGMKTWKTDKQTTNLLIKNNVFDHNRRQGVSLGNVNGALLEGNLFQNTNGTGPASGLDLEPGGDSNEVVENVTIKNNIFQNNTNQGLTMYAAPGTHVRNIKVLNNTFTNNGSWITGQVNIQQAENVEVAYNHVISDDGSRFYGIDSIGSSNVNIHDNYLPNGSIVITKDNPAAGFPTPSGSVKNNYVSSVTIEHNGFEQNNNGSPSQADVSIRSKIGADWNATDKTTHPDTITNEKLTLTGFNSRGKTYNVTENPQDTILGNYDPMNWKGTFSFDIDGSLLHRKSTGDDVIKFEKPMFTLYHNQDDQANLGTDELYLGNQGKPIYINGQNVGTLYSSYIISNGSFRGNGVQHVTVDNIDMGDGRLHINGADHKTANETIITTADGKKYGFSFRAADGTLNIPEDKSLNDTTKPDIPVIPTEETVSKTITMNFVWGDESNHFTLMNDGSNIVYAGINGQSGTAVTAPVHIKLTEKHENNQWILASAESDNPNVKVSIDRTNLLKPKVDINPQYHGITLVTDSKAPLSDSVNEFVLDLNPALTKDQMFSTFKSEYTTKVYVPKVKFSINYQNEATGKIIGSQLYQGDLTPDGAILKLNNQVPEGYQLDPNHSGDQVRWNGDKYLLELHKQSGWTTITNDMGKPDTNGSATYTSLLTESIIPIHKASLTYQFVDDNNNGANVGNPVVITGNVNSVQQVSELSVPTNYQLAAGQSLPTSVQIPQNNDTLKIHLVHVTQSVSDSKIIYRIINVTDPSGKVTTTKQSITINRQGTKDLVTNQTSWDKWSTASLPEYNVPVIAGYQASQIKVVAQPVTADSQDSTININYVANAQTANLVYKDGNKVVKTVPLTGKTGDTVDVNIAIPEHYHAISQVPESYTFKAERNADVVIQLGHDTQATSGFKTVTRTINVTDPNGKVTTTKQSATINRQGTKDLVTNQITWNDWSTTSLPEYDVPALDGYQATQNKVATQLVTSDSQGSVINIAYTANKQAVNVIYKDGNQIIKTVPLTGKTGETVKVPIDVPVNYHLTNQPADSYTFKANSNPDIVVELAHDMQSADDFKVITRVIKIIRPDGQVVTETQKAMVTRTGSKDAVTGEVAWNNWSTAKWGQYNATKILGYTSTMPVVSEQAVTNDTPDTTVEIKYVANSQQINIIYKDGNKVVKMTTLDGKTEETVDINLDVPEHYHVVNQVAKTYSFKADHNDDVIVELAHDVQQVSDSHTINRIINLNNPDGTKKVIKQSASINRIGAKDSVTGDITWSDWSDAQLPEYEVPVFDGYTASQSKVATEKVTSDTQDSTVDITYAANQQSVNIIYKDDNQVVKTAVLTGKTDETVKVPVEQPANYHIDGKTPTNYTFKAKDNQDIVINLGHDTQTVSQSKTVKRTINLELPGVPKKTIVQQVTFTRHGIKDLVTGKISWGSWDHDGKCRFDSYTPETVFGYEATLNRVDTSIVTPDSTNSEIMINYHRLVAKLVKEPEVTQISALKTTKIESEISQQSHPLFAKESNNALPQTGNNYNNKLLAGSIILGVIGVMMIPANRKRY